MDEASQVTPPTSTEHDWRKWCIGLGGLMMLLSLLLCFLDPPPQADMFYLVNRAFWAIGGGLLAGGVIGFIKYRGKILGNEFRSGGGFAVFLVLYLVNPAGLTAIAVAPPARATELRQIDQLASQSFQQLHGETNGQPRSLKDVVKQFGFKSVTHFKVTATDEQIEQVRSDLDGRATVPQDS